MMNKKGALEPDKYLVGLVLFTLFITVGVMVMQDINQNYDEVEISTNDFDQQLNISNNLSDLSIDLKEATFGKDIDSSDTPNSMFSGAYAALKLLSGSFRLVGQVINSVMSVLPIPPIFRVVAITIITILLVAAILYLVFRFQPRK